MIDTLDNMRATQPADPGTPSDPDDGNGARRLDTFGGVFTPSILTILGVVLYLLVPWTVGNLGLGGAMLVIVLSHVISLSTGLSVSSIATNRTVGAGGAYYMISRSLGAPAGAAVGIPLFCAQALSVAFYAVGFSESIVHLLPADLGHPVLNIFLDPRVGAGLSALILCFIAMKSAEAAIKVQYFVMAAIGLSLVAIFVGGISKSPAEIEWFMSEQTRSSLPKTHSFSEVFAVFFPAVTGIMAGVSMSGDLKDPRKSLPKGTLLAIGVGFVVYMIVPVFIAMNFSPAELLDPNHTVDGKPAYVGEYALFVHAGFLKPLVYLGLWGATLSSAVGSILAAPRTLQALATDGLAPKILAKGHGPANEPLIGMWVTFVLAMLGVLLGSLDAIATLLTIFFLATYGITNLACGLELWAANPSFRPTFRVSHWISLSGAAACFYVMSIIDLGSMAAAACICVCIYIFVQRRSLNTTYGDARHGLWSALARTALHHLSKTDYHDQNWRPNLLIFGGPAQRRRYLLEMGASVVQERGITSYIEMLNGEVNELAPIRKEKAKDLVELSGDYPNVFFRVDIVPDVYRGVVTTTQSYGIGSLEANTVMLGWPNKSERAAAYFQMLKELVQLENTVMAVNYDERRRFGRRREIHIWWGGFQANGGMMLLITYLIRAHHRWQNATVKVLTVVGSEEDRVLALAGLGRVLKSARLEAEPVVILRQGEAIEELMSNYSRRADLAILGLRLPENEMDSVSLFDHYNSLLSNLPTTVLVHSGGAFNAAPVLFDS